MTTRYVALLRGINVGGNRKVLMLELRQAFASHGLCDVRTYIQSGNVLFTAVGQLSAVDLQAVIADRFGIDIDVMLRTSKDLRRIVTQNPFPVDDPKLLHVGFMTEAPDDRHLQVLDLRPFVPERAEICGSEIYLYLPNGTARAKLPTYLDRHLQVPTTIRNWNTVNKLLELVSS